MVNDKTIIIITVFLAAPGDWNKVVLAISVDTPRGGRKGDPQLSVVGKSMHQQLFCTFR